MEPQAKRKMWTGLSCGAMMFAACVYCAYLLRNAPLMAAGFLVGALAGLMIIAVQLVFKTPPLVWGERYVKPPRWVKEVYIGMIVLMLMLMLLSY